jgi:hypothetical protein
MRQKDDQPDKKNSNFQKILKKWTNNNALQISEFY